MTIYDKPTKELMKEFAAAQLKPDQAFEKSAAVKWFSEHYPKIKPSTVQMHVEAMSVNAPLREHHSNVRQGSGHDLFYKIGPGQFRLWDPKSDPSPQYGDDFRAPQKLDGEAPQERSAEDIDGDVANEFAAERDLRNFLEKNLSALESGLRLYQEEGLSGIEFPAGGRRIDILAVDKDGGFVVIELKVSRGYDRAVGQIMRYMAWIKKNLADGKPVRGIILASDISEDLRLAASLIVGVKLVEYELSFRLRPVE
jgi:Endonuclease NucS C-terminal domain